MYCLARCSRAGNDRDVQSGDRILRCGRASAVIAEKAIGLYAGIGAGVKTLDAI